MNEKTIIVSLTTHSIRLNTVARTAIFSILKNTYKDIHIVLTLYKDDVKLIPEDLKLFIDNGVVELIIADTDLGPHLKYFYTMKKYRNNPIITIDDDFIYPEDTIENLVNFYNKFPDSIISRRAFVIQKPLNYRKMLNAGLSKIFKPSYLNFSTGCGGILYPPNILKISDDNIKDILEMKYDDDFYLKALETRLRIKITSSLYNPNCDGVFKLVWDENIQSIALWNTNITKSELHLKEYEKEFSWCVENEN